MTHLPQHCPARNDCAVFVPAVPRVNGLALVVILERHLFWQVAHGGVLGSVAGWSLTSRLVHIITRPQPGVWRLELSAGEAKPVEYSVVVFGQSEIRFGT